jgi:hypothetical protein
VEDSRKSILAELAIQFTQPRELLATSGLGHILRASSTAREALQRFLGDRGVVLPEKLAYAIEDVDPDHGGRPDVVAKWEGQRRLILEGKFWASLTEAQPVGYLDSLPPEGCLLLVAPGRRFEILGSELVSRCADAGRRVDAEALLTSGLSRVDDRWIGVVSWDALLGHLRAALADAGEARLAADVEQLESLARLEDSDAFLPLSPSDLSNPTPQRVYQYFELVDQVCDRGVTRGVLQRRSGLRSGYRFGRFTRYIAAGPFQVAIYADLSRWAKQLLTPLWLEIAVDPGDALEPLEAEHQKRVFFDGDGGSPVVPLTLRLGVELDTVLDDLVSQIEEAIDLVRDRRPTVVLADVPAEGPVESEADA